MIGRIGGGSDRSYLVSRGNREAIVLKTRYRHREEPQRGLPRGEGMSPSRAWLVKCVMSLLLIVLVLVILHH